MATESVKILIEAEDLASSKIANAAAKIDQNVKSIKDIGGKAKASTEFIGQLAGFAGGSEVGALASQVGGLTEKVSQFSEVSKLGGAGALAFKAGLAGLVGVVGFEFGKAIGNAVFQTEKWNEELAEAHTRSKELTSELIRQQEYRRGIEQRQIALLPESEQVPAQKIMLEKLQEDLEKFKEQRKQSLQAIKEQEKALTLSNFLEGQTTKGLWGGFTDFASDNMSAAFAKASGDIDTAKDKLQEADQQIASLTRDVEGLRRATSETEISMVNDEKENARKQAAKQFLASLKQQNELMSAQGDALYQLRAEAAGLNAEEQKRAVELMRQADAEKMRREQAAETSRAVIEAARQEEAAREKSNSLLLSEVERLKARALVLKEGEAAAKQYRLEQQGVSSDLAKQLIEAEGALAKAEEAKARMGGPAKQMGPTPELQAFQSRMLTRGPSQNNEPMRKVEKNTEDMAKLLENVEALMAKVAESTAKTANERGVKLIEVR